METVKGIIVGYISSPYIIYVCVCEIPLRGLVEKSFFSRIIEDYLIEFCIL